MRIHGDEVILRRKDVALKNKYKDYKDDLRVDFKQICGYCGKHEFVTKKGFEIDHFVPIHMDPLKQNDYSNLVYCCFTCNRKKSGKWPTKDKTKPNDGMIGFVDPASSEYDEHLMRDSDGVIIYNTTLGKYICEEVFKFSIRPMREIWKLMELFKAKNRLGLLINELQIQTEEDATAKQQKYQQYVQRFRNVIEEMDKLQEMMFERDE